MIGLDRRMSVGSSVGPKYATGEQGSSCPRGRTPSEWSGEMLSASCTPGAVSVSRVTRGERSETVSCVVGAVSDGVLACVFELEWPFFFFLTRFFFALWGPGIQRRTKDQLTRRVLTSHEIKAELLTKVISNCDSLAESKFSAQRKRLICICHPLHLAQYTHFGTECYALRAIVK